MKIGYIVEGLCDLALLEGLRDRWCPDAELVPPDLTKIRGTTLRKKRDTRLLLPDFIENKRCSAIVLMEDSDIDNWRKARDEVKQRIPASYIDVVAIGCPARNVECWFEKTTEAFGKLLGCKPDEIPKDDPSAFVKSRLSLMDRDEGKAEGKKKLIEYVRSANLKVWIASSPSFEDFYDQAKVVSSNTGCSIPNEKD